MIKQNYIHPAQKGLYDTLPHLQILKHNEGGFTQAADVLSSGRVKNNCHTRNIVTVQPPMWIEE